jgi:hypothetical protein
MRMKKTLRLEKEGWVFSFWDGFETPVDRIPQPETAFQTPALLFVSGWGFAIWRKISKTTTRSGLVQVSVPGAPLHWPACVDILG